MMETALKLAKAVLSDHGVTDAGISAMARILEEIMPMAAVRTAPDVWSLCRIVTDVTTKLLASRGVLPKEPSREQVIEYVNNNRVGDEFLGVRVAMNMRQKSKRAGPGVRRVVPPKGNKPVGGLRPDAVYLDDLDEDGDTSLKNESLSLFYEWWNARPQELKTSPGEAARQAWGAALEVAHASRRAEIRRKALGTTGFAGTNELRVSFADVAVEPSEPAAKAALVSWCLGGIA